MVVEWFKKRIPHNRPELRREWRAVLMHDPCVYCGGKATGLDHIVPVTAGGPDHWENRAPACQDCDAAKATAKLVGFLLGELIAHKKVARRSRYRDSNARRAAIVMIRAQIAQQFYSGNIRIREVRSE